MVHQDHIFKSHKDFLPRSGICKRYDVYKMVDLIAVNGVRCSVVMKYMALNINYIFIIYNIISITKYTLCLLNNKIITTINIFFLYILI